MVCQHVHACTVILLYVLVHVSRHAVQGLVGDVEGGKGHTSLVKSSDKWCEEEGYFGSYTHYKIHEDMLKVGVTG